jgi:acyl-CoA hydrolase
VLTLRFLAEPTDVNFGGNVHGGAVMKWIDQSGYACAVQWCGGYAVTVYVGGIRFLRSIAIGNIVELRAQIIYTGTTSMHISVDVYSKAPQSTEYIHNTHCVIVFVAIDEHRKPIPVPAFHPSTERERHLMSYAKRLVELRSSIESEMNQFLPR